MKKQTMTLNDPKSMSNYSHKTSILIFNLSIIAKTPILTT
jgi:hypothetical protein